MSNALSKLRECDWKPMLPVAVILALYVLFMPKMGSPAFSSLDPHQQLLALSSIPCIWGGIFWFFKRNRSVLEKQSPEERVLDE